MLMLKEPEINRNVDNIIKQKVKGEEWFRLTFGDRNAICWALGPHERKKRIARTKCD